MDYHGLIITYSMILSSASESLFERDVVELLEVQQPISPQLTRLLEVCCHLRLQSHVIFYCLV